MSDYSPTQQQQNLSQSTAFAEALQRAKQVSKFDDVFSFTTRIKMVDKTPR